jgi:membrane protease YdiL (CAAX protease family)
MLKVMNELILDRRGRMLETPAFLAPVTERERSWWRLLLMVVVGGLLAVLASLVAVIVVVLVAVLVGGMPLDDLPRLLSGEADESRPLLSYSFELAAAGLSLIATALVIVPFAARLYRRPVKSFITAAPRFRWALVAIGFAVAAPLVGLAIAAEVAIGETTLEPPILRATDWSEAAGYIGVAVVFLFMAALAEEMFFRGWLLQQTSAFTRSIPILLIVNGVLFSLIHVDPDPGAFFVRAAMGAGWCWIGLRLGGLEFATGAHLANNLAVTLFVQPLTFTLPTGEPSDLGSVIVQLAVVGATIAAVEYGLRRRRAAAA